MKKIVLFLLSFFMLTSISAQENHLESADTGILVQIVGQLIPINKIEIINSTCVIGMANIAEAGGLPAIAYSFWSDDYGIMQNTLGLELNDTEIVTIIMMFDEGTDEGVQALKNWIKENSPKDDKLIEDQARNFMKQYNKNDSDYIMFRAEDQKIRMARNIAIIYCTKELARQRGISVE